MVGFLLSLFYFSFPLKLTHSDVPILEMTVASFYSAEVVLHSGVHSEMLYSHKEAMA